MAKLSKMEKSRHKLMAMVETHYNGNKKDALKTLKRLTRKETAILCYEMVGNSGFKQWVIDNI